MTKKRAEGAIAACLGFGITLFIFSLYISSLTNFTRIQVPKRWGVKSRATAARSTEITCNRTHRSYDLCWINGPTLLDPTQSTLFLMDIPHASADSSFMSLKTRPYTRKIDAAAMSQVKELTLTSAPPNTTCGVTHVGPALVFSAGGYTGNFFHEFSDGLVPLFITVESLFPNHNVHFVVTDLHLWWAHKYSELLKSLTRHPIIDMDRDSVTHCFSSAVVGLVSHGPMTVDPEQMPQSRPRTLGDFNAFLGHAYGHETGVRGHHRSHLGRPRLVLVSRSRKFGRSILNQAKLCAIARRVGFDVTVFRPNPNTPLAKAYQMINASHVMVGVHGAGLTHSLFLRPGSVLVQVVPVATEWVSETYFGGPAKALGLHYLEYKIKPEESSLVEKFGIDSVVMKNPKGFTRGNWTNMGLYLKDQNVKLDLARFRACLKEAYAMAKRLMEEENKGDGSSKLSSTRNYT